jgi:hypothetical protein
MNNQTQEALKMLDAIQIKYSDLIYNEAGFEKAEEFEDDIIAVKEAIATNEESSLVQPAQEPITFEMDELTEEWYGVLDDKTALIIYGGNRGYWSNKIYANSTPDSTLDSTPAIEKALSNQEGNKESNQQPAQSTNEHSDELAEVLIALKDWVISAEMRLAKLEQALKEKNHG